MQLCIFNWLFKVMQRISVIYVESYIVVHPIGKKNHKLDLCNIPILSLDSNVIK